MCDCWLGTSERPPHKKGQRSRSDSLRTTQFHAMRRNGNFNFESCRTSRKRHVVRCLQGTFCKWAPLLRPGSHPQGIECSSVDQFDPGIRPSDMACTPTMPRNFGLCLQDGQGMARVWFENQTTLETAPWNPKRACQAQSLCPKEFKNYGLPDMLQPI